MRHLGSELLCSVVFLLLWLIMLTIITTSVVLLLLIMSTTVSLHVLAKGKLLITRNFQVRHCLLQNLKVDLLLCVSHGSISYLILILFCVVHRYRCTVCHSSIKCLWCILLSQIVMSNFTSKGAHVTVAVLIHKRLV